MRFLILRILTHSELGMFHAYRRQGKEVSRQRAVNFDGDVVDRVFPAAKDVDAIEMDLRYDSDIGVSVARQWLKRQEKNWRLEGNCPKDECYAFVVPGCLFAMEVDAGTNPASGAWAVFAPDSAVTKAIIADGESSRLTSSSMIALHDEEGERTRSILSEARPDLFPVLSKKRASQYMGTKRNPNGVELAPNPARLVQILAAVGHTMPSAVADLVDNAISADATDIAITFGPPNGGHGRWMSIVDNGNGMQPDALAEAMRVGSDSDYEANSLGKYGYGLKGASWSQAKVFTVVTRQEGSPAHHLTWDVNDMDGWIAKSNPLESWEEDATALGSHGTAVLWKDMRLPQVMPAARNLDPHSSEIMLLERHLALVFHRFLEGRAAGRKTVTITINTIPVKPNNPFGHPLTSPYDSKTIRIPTETGYGRVVVQAHLLPSEDEVTEYHQSGGAEAVRRALDLIGLHGKRNETQGLFIYRHDRLIKWGGWHQMWETNDEKTKLARIVVDFDSILDDTFRINVSKQIVQLPQQLQAEIKMLADVARKDSQRKYRKEARRPIATPQTPQPIGVRDRTGPPLTGTSSHPADDTPAPPASTPRIALKEVRTDKFVWKLTKSLTGAIDVQVSEMNPALSALVKQIRSDQQAVVHLAAFLGGLDEVDAQSRLIGKRNG